MIFITPSRRGSGSYQMPVPKTMRYLKSRGKQCLLRWSGFLANKGIIFKELNGLEKCQFSLEKTINRALYRLRARSIISQHKTWFVSLLIYVYKTDGVVEVLPQLLLQKRAKKLLKFRKVLWIVTPKKCYTY